MNPVIQRLQQITKSNESSIFELINIYARQYPNNGVAMALKDYAFSENNHKITEAQMLKILSNHH